MIAFKLAIRNLMGAGLRTWLNAAVLSFAFVVIVFYNGMLDGWNQRSRSDTIRLEVGSGQLWHPSYDRYDPFTLQDARAPLTKQLAGKVASGQLTPLLIIQATAYPGGRGLNILLKGIDPEQDILQFPSRLLKSQGRDLKALIGKRMASAAGLRTGDQVLVRWRDINGTFDAGEVEIKEVFDSDVPGIDVGQFWLPLSDLQRVTGMTDQATLLVAGPSFDRQPVSGWVFRDQGELLSEFDGIMQSKKAGASIIYGLLLAIALLALFDTQVLAIFRRQREIGTYIALGMTRSQVAGIFTVEGSFHSLLALAAAGVYGIPFLAWLHRVGIPMPEQADQAGIAISGRIIPVYGAGMVLATVLLVVVSSVIVSYLPSRKISRMSPTAAIKGKIQ